MDCVPKIDFKLADNGGSVKTTVVCEGTCEDRDGCVPHWSLDTATYPDVEISGDVTSGNKAEFNVKATGGKLVPFQVDIHCSCGDDNSKTKHVKGHLKYVRPLWQDVISFGVTALVDALKK